MTFSFICMFIYGIIVIGIWVLTLVEPVSDHFVLIPSGKESVSPPLSYG